MKKSEMAERMRKHFNTEHCDQVALLAYQIIDFLEQQGMRPPPYCKAVLTGPLTKEGVSNLVLLGRVEKCEGWEDEE